MTNKINAGIDLDKLEEIADRLGERGSFATSAELRDMIALARRAEPSVTAADERALFEADTRELYPAATFGRFPMSDNYNVSWVQEQWGGWQRRAALASPAVSQKDGEADCTEPNREACPRLCRDFCNAAEEARAATTASAPAAAVRAAERIDAMHKGVVGVFAAIKAEHEAATTASASIDVADLRDAYEADIGHAPIPSRDAAPEIKAWFDRIGGNTDIRTAMQAEIDDLRAALAQQGASQAPLDVRAGFEKWMSDRGEAANYAGDGMYESPSVNRKAEAFRAGVEYVALARAPLPAKDRELADVLRDMLAIQEACGLHTDEYAPGSVIEYIKEMEGESVAAPAQAGDARDAALFRKVVELGIQLHFEGGDGEDDAVWVNCLMKWADGDRLGATRELVEQEAKNLAAMSAPQGKKGGVA